jgi:hypothetical protein
MTGGKLVENFREKQLANHSESKAADPSYRLGDILRRPDTAFAQGVY